jgi:5'(3')-deoxyribonucleotidase
MTTITDILLDVDGVLADFFGHALAVHGRSELAHNWPAGEWDMAKVMGISESCFWEKVDAPSFWSTLPSYWMSCEFLAALHEFGTVTFTTSFPYPVASECFSAKVDWLRENMEAEPHEIMIGCSKWLMAKPTALLIDDNDRNVDRFVAEGGNAILFPRPWNRRHLIAEQCRIGGVELYDVVLHEVIKIMRCSSHDVNEPYHCEKCGNLAGLCICAANEGDS